MSSIVKKNFDSPDEVVLRTSQGPRLPAGRCRRCAPALEPGWSWSSCVKPMVGGDSCQARHVGTVIQGTMVAKHNDGTTQTFKAGDTYIEPGHDGWVEGDEAVVALSSIDRRADLRRDGKALAQSETASRHSASPCRGGRRPSGHEHDFPASTRPASRSSKACPLTQRTLIDPIEAAELAMKIACAGRGSPAHWYRCR